MDLSDLSLFSFFFPLLLPGRPQVGVMTGADGEKVPRA